MTQKTAVPILATLAFLATLQALCKRLGIRTQRPWRKVEDCNLRKDDTQCHLHCCIVFEICANSPQLILGQVKVQATHTRTFTANGNSRPQKSGVNKGFSASDRFFSGGWQISKSHSKSVTNIRFWRYVPRFSGVKERKIIDYLKGRQQ